MLEKLPAPSTWEPLGAVPPAALVDARLQLHWAAQAVAAAGHTLLPAADDDSQASLRWEDIPRALAGQPVPPRGLRAALRPHDLSLLVLDGSGAVAAHRGVEGETLNEALEWLRGALDPGGPATAPLRRPEHDLPRHPVGAGAPFAAGAPAARAELARWFANGERVLEAIAASLEQASPVRCWPHHFDLATLVRLDPEGDTESARSIGLGLSPGDGTCAEPYWYVLPWPPPRGAALPPLGGGGRWQTEGWLGAVLPGSALVGAGEQAAQVVDFLRTATLASTELVVG